MTTSERDALCKNRDDLNAKIKECYSVLEFQSSINTAGLSFILHKKDSNNNIHRKAVLFSWLEPGQVPDEIITFLKSYVERLIAERNNIWSELKKAGIEEI